LNKLGFIRKFRPKRFHKIDPQLFEQKGVTRFNYKDAKEFVKTLGWNPNSRLRRCPSTDNKTVVRLTAKLRNYFVYDPEHAGILCVQFQAEGGGLRLLHVLPHGEVDRVLAETHERLNHPGMKGMFDAIGQTFWWPAWKKQTSHFVLACDVCKTVANDAPSHNANLGQTSLHRYPRLMRWAVELVEGSILQNSVF
jgi:hypothetical protein